MPKCKNCGRRIVETTEGWRHEVNGAFIKRCLNDNIAEPIPIKGD